MGIRNAIWRGAVEPHETQGAGLDGNKYLAWRGAVEVSVDTTSDVAAKLNATSIFSIDISITGRLQEQTVDLIEYQDATPVMLQDGSFLDNFVIRPDQIGGQLCRTINLTGVFG